MILLAQANQKYTFNNSMQSFIIGKNSEQKHIFMVT